MSLDSGSAAARVLIRNELTRWLADPDLSVLSDPAELKKLAPSERQECRRLWSEVERLLKRAPGIEIS